MDIHAFWQTVLAQDAKALRTFFAPGAYINWHCTNEHFSAEEFIRANCLYPGDWNGTLERLERLNDLLITVVHVYSPDRSLSFHVTSFIQLQDGLICSIDEYWGDDGPAPQWRQDMKIGTPIHL